MTMAYASPYLRSTSHLLCHPTAFGIAKTGRKVGLLGFQISTRRYAFQVPTKGRLTVRTLAMVRPKA